MHSCQLLGFGVLTVGETRKVTSNKNKGFAGKLNFMVKQGARNNTFTVENSFIKSHYCAVLEGSPVTFKPWKELFICRNVKWVKH